MYNPSYTPKTSATGSGLTAGTNPLLGGKDSLTDIFKNMGLNFSGDNEIKPALNALVAGYFPGAASNAQFTQELTKQRQALIRQYLAQMGKGAQQAQMRGLQNQVGEQGANAARNTSLMNRASGMGDGFQAGNTAGIMGQAAHQQNDIAREYASPEHEQRTLASALQAIMQGYQNPELDTLLQMYGPMFNSQQYNNQQASQHGLGGFINQIAPIAGMAAGYPGMFSRPSGGGGTSYNGANSNYAGIFNNNDQVYG